jgi:acetyl/propionyl-CoA carboxylase alpha subunit
VVLERFVSRPRHVEVQVLADTQGRTLHVHERECSLQRRHQKVVEETPSPALSPETRERLCAAGVAAARAASYVNAGTVEFLLDPEGRFYFLEMNTRLQVEHPVTEAVTGLDLVRLQIEIASGRPLALTQDQIAPRGHALECRVYAEDPDNDDLPAPGRVLLCVPPIAPGVRFDAGIETGSEVTVHYDPLLAKLVTHGADRAFAIARMRAALRETVVLGLRTNLARLQAILDHPEFVAGNLHTGFLDEHKEALAKRASLPDEALAAAAAALQLSNGDRQPRAGHGSVVAARRLALGGAFVACGSSSLAQPRDVATRTRTSARSAPHTFVLEREGRSRVFHCVQDGDVVYLSWDGRPYELRIEKEGARAVRRHSAGGLEAPMPGRVIKVNVAGRAMRSSVARSCWSSRR